MTNPAGSNTLIPTGWAITVGTTSALAIPQNTTRSGLIWINQSSAVIAICPSILNTVVAGVITNSVVGVAAIGAAGSITMQPGDKFIIDNMPCGCQWNAIAASAGSALTAFETY